MKGFTLRISIFSLLLIGLFACSHSKDDKTATRISRKDFIQILADIHVTQSLISSNTFRETYNDYDSIDIVEQVVNAHNYSKASFDSTITFYTHHADKYLLVYEGVIKELNKRQSIVFEEKRDTTHASH